MGVCNICRCLAHFHNSLHSNVFNFLLLRLQKRHPRLFISLPPCEAVPIPWVTVTTLLFTYTPPSMAGNLNLRLQPLRPTTIPQLSVQRTINTRITRWNHPCMDSGWLNPCRVQVMAIIQVSWLPRSRGESWGHAMGQQLRCGGVG